MRRVSILLMVLLSHLTVWAQDSEEPIALLFEHTVWDFGTINEVDGEIRHTFRYCNISDGFVTIERVYSSCGCTTGEYSRRPLKAGGEGEFTVVFNPADRGGRVSKSITLVYDEGRGRTNLYIKGRVVARPRSVEDTYPYELGGGVRSDSSIKPFGRVDYNKSKSMTIAIVNTSQQSVEIGIWRESESGALEINAPLDLSPNEEALVTLTYVPSEATVEHNGLLIDEFRIVVDGVPSEMVFRASAVVENNE